MIIDFHTHVFPDKIAARTVAALSRMGNIKPYSDGTVEGLISSLGLAGASLAVSLPVLTKPSQFDSITEFAKDLNAREYMGPRVISFGGIHPLDEEYEEKLSLLKREGFLGIKIHPDYQGTFIDDDKYVRIIECAKRLGLIVVTHAGFDVGYVGQPIRCTPQRVFNLLEKIGGYDKLVLAHIGGNELFSDVYSILAGKDVYFDTGLALHSIGEDMFKKILDRHGDRKILFATDSPWRDIREEVEIIRSYKLSSETERRIFSENAIELLERK